jgi:acetylornithine deacetylase/succinyl-diaminopimelate desuccinylase-like protein
MGMRRDRNGTAVRGNARVSRCITPSLLALLAATEVFAAQPYPAMARDTLRDLVNIDSAEPRGTLASVNTIARRFRAAKFSARDLTLLAPAAHPEKANLVVRLRGRGRGRPLLWTAHLDVVEADPQDWSVPPFHLTESGGWYYGRGTADMKGEVAALVTAMIRLKAEGFVPRHDLIVALTADEEAAGQVNGIRWLLSEHPALLDAGVAFNPDTGAGALRGGRRLFYGIETAEKTYATYRLDVRNKGGHSSQPEADNAIYRLSAALLKLSAFKFPLRLTATTRAFLSADADLEPDAIANAIRAVLKNPADAAAIQELGDNPRLNAQIRSTCVATRLAAGSAENALPQRAQAAVQCRLLPGDTSDGAMQTLRMVIDDPDVVVELVRPSNNSPETLPDPKVMDAIRGAVDSMWPEVPVMVTMAAGGSDAIFTRSAGIPTYGVASIFQDIDDNRHHGRDERIAIAAFDEGVEFTYHLMKALDAKLN